MSLNLPEAVRNSYQPLFEALPLDSAMYALVKPTPQPDEIQAIVQQIIDQVQPSPGVAAGLWLYVDNLDKAHELAQADETATGAWWHSIIHRREGDFWNAKYWYRRAIRHPAVEQIASFDPYRFVDRVEGMNGLPSKDLLELQRLEWRVLFESCVEAAQ